MRITRLFLRNYRVYEDPVELELPAGLVGIYGANGSGKSTLLEAVTWTLWGRARTTKDELRSAGVGGECVSEVQFEHEGHLYTVRRTLAGQAASVRAETHADGSQVAEGVRDVAHYLHSVLGMDDPSFRASVFAEQKQLAAFSSTAPAERRRLVLGLLGVTPLDSARDQARRDAKGAAEAVEQMRALLVDIEELAAEVARAAEQADAAAAAAETASSSEARAGAAKEEADEAHGHLERSRLEHDALVREGRARRDEADGARRRVDGLRAEAAALAADESRLPELDALQKELGALEASLAHSRQVASLAHELSTMGVGAAPARPDPSAAGAASEASQVARGALDQVTGRLAGAEAEAGRATEALERSAGLSSEEDCPLCGQPLGQAFEQVADHRRQESGRARALVSALREEKGHLEMASRRAGEAERVAVAALESSRSAWSAWERAAERRGEAEGRLAEVLVGARATGLVPPAEGGDAPEGLAVWAEESATAAGRELEQRRRAAEEATRVRARLERIPVLRSQLTAETERVAALDEEVAVLRDKVRALAFDPATLAAAAQARAAAGRKLEEAVGAARQAHGTAVAARSAAEGEARRLAEARANHELVAERVEGARHLGRAADLLNAFRNTVVGTIGPRLSAQAAELFAELTDREYDRLEVDPETFEIQIRDQGVLYGMDRFSGSETDLANLALRVAISEQIRFQSGGAVGLLVLDEVFGPLDDDRKDRMLAALERLRGRFRQVLVVTHDVAVKEQLPSAIEVVKLPGRRATARLM